MYTIYPLTVQQIKAKSWIESTTLLVVCGSVSADFSAILLDYFFKGGKMLCLCSDLLHLVLPTYQTAEVCLMKKKKYGIFEEIYSIFAGS